MTKAETSDENETLIHDFQRVGHVDHVEDDGTQHGGEDTGTRSTGEVVDREKSDMVNTTTAHASTETAKMASKGEGDEVKRPAAEQESGTDDAGSEAKVSFIKVAKHRNDKRRRLSRTTGFIQSTGGGGSGSGDDEGEGDMAQVLDKMRKSDKADKEENEVENEM